MKELSIKEKAKAYDKVRDKIAIRFGSNVAKEIFSEYEESEDEKIRKSIIHLVKKSHEQGGYALHKDESEKMLDWLEKQSKNNIGISEATKQKLEDNLNKALEKETPESWNKFLDEQAEQKPMNEKSLYKAGYLDGFEDGVRDAIIKEDEQKVAWSEEDEGMRINLIQGFEMMKDGASSDTVKALYDKKIDWLESLRPQSQWKPSDEQIEILDMVLTNESMDDNIARILRELREQLKKLREE